MKIEEKTFFTFDDVLIKPQYSEIKSRKDVDLRSTLMGMSLDLPIFSANMDTITEVAMAKAMQLNGGMGVLHRFWTIEENVKAFLETKAAVSVGLGSFELNRAKALIDAGAKRIFIDVAHGAATEVANQLSKIKSYSKDVFVCVGNFASKESLGYFLGYSEFTPDAIKVGIGPGSACTTRVKTGVGVPQLSAIIECVSVARGIPVIADGGLKTPGDIAKALAAGASAVMVGGMLAGTTETPGEIEGVVHQWVGDFYPSEIDFSRSYKKYRGSASKESYVDQGKDTAWRTTEGESFTVPYKGSIDSVLKDIEGGLRSSFAYTGAISLLDFQEKVILIRVSAASIKESGAHGKK